MHFGYHQKLGFVRTVIQGDYASRCSQWSRGGVQPVHGEGNNRDAKILIAGPN